MKNSVLSYWKAYCNHGSQVRSFSAIPVHFVAEYTDNLVGVSVCHLQALLQKCATSLTVQKGMVLHGQIIQAGLQVDTLLANIIINMYSKCGLVDYARKVFDMMPERSVVSWNTIIGAHTQRGEGEQALSLFVEMQRERTIPSEFTLSSVLCACAAKSAVCESKQLHALALKIAFDSNVYVGTALLDVYAKSELINDAHSIFDSMPQRSAVTWSSMVSGYVQNNLFEESLMLFHRGQKMDFEQNQFTLSSVLSACASLSVLIEGNQIHAVLVRTGFHSDVFVSASLIDMYAKCGSIEDAYLVFSLVEVRNIVLWNALMSGFARHARSIEVMILFEKMLQSGTFPNEVTYVSVLSACSHMGLVELGQRYFDLMMRDPNVCPNVQHFSCMVDLLGRAGKIREAYNLIESMPFEATASMWGSLLGSCKIYRNHELAEIAATHLFRLEPDNGGNHVLLSNVYAANKMWGEVARSRKHLKDSGVRKEMGKSWIEVKGKVHTFTVGEGSHPRSADIYAKLESLVLEMKKFKYKADTEEDLHDVEEDEKEQLLRHHSEKLALAFGLISLPSAAPIRIKKNLRICGDCHSFIMVVSKISGREIIVRDINRFHHFKDGRCSCGGFW